MNRILKILLFVAIIKPISFLALGLNIKGREKLPMKGPAIIISNHNSHLDAMVLMSLYPLLKIHKIRPVGASDYFFKNKFMSWFSTKCLGIIPINRQVGYDIDNLFADCYKALDNNDIIIIFPEGSRGNPEQMGKVKRGLFYLHKKRPNADIIPIVTHGLGKSLPRGTGLFVPFNCDVIVGDKIETTDCSKEFAENIYNNFQALLKHCLTRQSED